MPTTISKITNKHNSGDSTVVLRRDAVPCIAAIISLCVGKNGLMALQGLEPGT